MTRRGRRLGYAWHLRLRMAERGMFSTTDLIPLLADRGVILSSVQVYRLVVQTPERLNLNILAALCDILECSPTDLIEVTVAVPAARKTATVARKPAAAVRGRRPVRARITGEAE